MYLFCAFRLPSGLFFASPFLHDCLFFPSQMFHYMNDRKNYYSDEEIETIYDRVEKIISLMNLGEKHLIVLNGRLRGDTYAQLAAILHCTTGGVQGFRLVMKKRYFKVMRNHAHELYDMTEI